MTGDVEAVVIGGGPAGLAAALWLGRFRRRTIVVDDATHRNRWVELSHGYLGMDPVAPRELLARARREVERYGVQLLPARAHATRREEEAFVVAAGGEELRARRVVLACGASDRFPRVEGFEEHYGTSVFTCPACDGYEARDRDVVALGWTDEIASLAVMLQNWARSVTIVTEGRRFEGGDRLREQLAARGIETIEDDSVRLLGTRGALEGVDLRGGRRLPAQLVFFSIEVRPRTALAESLGCELDDEGAVRVDDQGRTSVPGVYAAGDLVPGPHLIQVAAASGARAGIGCARSLIDT